MPLAALFLALQAPTPAPEVPRARGWDDFPVFVWREKYAGRPLPEELAQPFGGVLLMREEDPGWARERGLSTLVWNVAGRDALHLDADDAWNRRVEDWIRTQDPRLLVREPCLNDPRTIARLCATLDATLAKHGEPPGLGFVLGDEVSLTPNGAPFDLCRCPLCETRWRAYAREHALAEQAPLTDEVRVALAEGDESKLGAWLARRRFEREGLVDLLRVLAQRAEHLGRPLGVLGIAGETPFGGLDVQECLQFLQLSECYPVAEARDLEWTARIPGPGLDGPGLDGPGHDGPGHDLSPSLATVFLQDETPDGAAWVAWDHWMRGGTGLVVWSDTQLAAEVDHARRLAQALRSIRALPGGVPGPFQFPGGALGGLALVRDADSAAYSWLKDALLDGPTWPRRLPSHQAEHGSRERKVNPWRKAAQDAGLRPGALSAQGIGGLHTASTTFPVLVLIDLAILGEDECRRLERHLDEGGVLVVDGELGTRDRAGLRREISIVEQLRKRAPERVLENASPSRAAVERACALAGLTAGVPLRLGPAMARVDWLVTARPDRDLGEGNRACSRWTVALLPNLATPADRRTRLRDLPLEVEPPDGWSLEWLHPPSEAPRVLPAGDAAVLRLRELEEPPR